VERPAAAGDLVVLDYTLTPEGLPPSSQSGYEFLVGSGSVLPEIDAAVPGLPAGEEREITVRFADDHRREELRGRAGSARIKIVEVKEKLLPPLDDELARSLGEFDSLPALRAEIRNQLEARRAAEERHALEEKAVDALVARHAFTVPEALVMRQVAQQIEHARGHMRRQGLDPDQLPWDYQKLLGELRPGADKTVRRALLLEAVAEREGLAPADADVEAEVERIARAAQRPVPAVRRMMEKSGELDAVRQRLRERMTLELLVRHAQVRAN
jgi:trigger factor